MRSALEERLRSRYETCVVASSVELLDTVVQARPDLVLLDGRLCGDQEIELLEAVRGTGVLHGAVAAVLFPTGDMSEELEARARGLGAHVYRDRKLRTSTLVEVIERALAGEEPAPNEGQLLSICERLKLANPFRALGVPPDAEPDAIQAQVERLERWLAAGHDSDDGELQRVTRAARADLACAAGKLTAPASLEIYRKDPDHDEHSAEREEAQQLADAEKAHREGEALIDRQRWGDARERFERAVELNPDEGVFRASLGWATYLEGGAEPWVLKEAIGHALEGMKRAPEHFQPFLVAGRLYQMTNRLDLAEKALKRAVRLNPDSIEAVRELRILKSRDKRQDAKSLLSKLLGR